MSIHHLGIRVNDFEKLTAFYEAALAPLGFKRMMSPAPGVIGMGSPTCGPTFWLTDAKAEASAPTNQPAHIAFAANSRHKIRAFYEAAISAGATCNGKPGVRKEYLRTYYGAYVFDPEGRNIEACCLAPGFWAERTWAEVVIAAGAVAAGLGAWWAGKI